MTVTGADEHSQPNPTTNAAANETGTENDVVTGITADQRHETTVMTKLAAGLLVVAGAAGAVIAANTYDPADPSGSNTSTNAAAGNDPGSAHAAAERGAQPEPVPDVHGRYRKQSIVIHSR